MEKPLRTLGYAFIGLAIAIVFVGLFLSAADAIATSPKAGDLATWSGAFGTILAFVGTIWLATAETRRRKREEMVKASLAAAGLLTRLITAQNVEATTLEIFEILAEVDVHDFGPCAGHIRSGFARTHEEIVPLAPLKNDCAVKLAGALGNLYAVQELFSRAGADCREMGDRIKFVQAVRSRLTECCAQLEAAILECTLVIPTEKLPTK